MLCKTLRQKNWTALFGSSVWGFIIAKSSSKLYGNKKVCAAKLYAYFLRLTGGQKLFSSHILVKPCLQLLMQVEDVLSGLELNAEKCYLQMQNEPKRQVAHGMLMQNAGKSALETGVLRCCGEVLLALGTCCEGFFSSRLGD